MKTTISVSFILSLIIHSLCFSFAVSHYNKIKKEKYINLNVGLKSINVALYYSKKQNAKKKGVVKEREKKKEKKLPKTKKIAQKLKKKTTKKIIPKKNSNKNTYATSAASPIQGKNRPPRYPGIAIARGYEGTVILGALVNEKGRSEEIRVIKSSGYSTLDQHAAHYVSKWEFNPAIKNGKKIKSWIKIKPITFTIREPK